MASGATAIRGNLAKWPMHSCGPSCQERTHRSRPRRFDGRVVVNWCADEIGFHVAVAAYYALFGEIDREPEETDAGDAARAACLLLSPS